MPLRRYLLVLLLVSYSLPLAIAAEPALEVRVRNASPTAVHRAYSEYRLSRNATRREELVVALQASLDTDPTVLLSIKGINVEAFCDGNDIDAASGLNTLQMVALAKKRISTIKSSSLPNKIKSRCVSTLSSFVTCAQSGKC